MGDTERLLYPDGPHKVLLGFRTSRSPSKTTVDDITQIKLETPVSTSQLGGDTRGDSGNLCPEAGTGTAQGRSE